MKEKYISVDVETAGPIPGEYSLLTIGACLIEAPERSFKCALKPLSRNAVPEALEVTGLSLDELEAQGVAPVEAMRSFGEWVEQVCAGSYTPVLVGLNAPFDWSFVNFYFHKFLGQNPFGISALDLKALYMGATGCSWTETTAKHMAKRLRPQLRGTHDALDDALFQAELFSLIRSIK
ncbi:3'-5' exonuclease [Variovorax sp. LjRoot175]|uniref:3'-5' exonuclease n=1 Tax=Variovorax sp. LjRoot175 TaxID=3342276 RepID=UPI003ECF8745